MPTEAARALLDIVEWLEETGEPMAHGGTAGVATAKDVGDTRLKMAEALRLIARHMAIR